MKAFIEQHAPDQLKKPRDCLISSFHCQDQWILSALFSFYVEHGLHVKNISEVLAYERGQPFKEFADNITLERMEADRDKQKVALGETAKLKGNTGYGKSLTNVEQHQEVLYCSRQRAQLLANSPFLRDMERISSDCYEVSLARREIEFNLPIQIGNSNHCSIFQT
jgi:hypothetical protein